MVLNGGTLGVGTDVLTTGGVTIWAAADPQNALLNSQIYAEGGPRTIKATIRIELPRGFQTSEFLLEHGFIDRIVPRSKLKSEIARTIDYCGK